MHLVAISLCGCKQVSDAQQWILQSNKLVDPSVDHEEVVPNPHHLMCVCIKEKNKCMPSYSYFPGDRQRGVVFTSGSLAIEGFKVDLSFKNKQ